MSRFVLRGLLAASALSAVSSYALPGLAADEKKACVAAYEQAQLLRNESKLREAKVQLLVCARDVCPGMLRTDCVSWLSDVETNTPSVVVDAKDSVGKDISNVKVTVDGKPFATKLDGKSIAMDPGAHTFRYETSGFPVIEEQVIVKQGEKNRRIGVVFKASGEPIKEKTDDPKSPGPAVVDLAQPSNRKTIAYVLGGVGVVGLGVGTFFYLSGKGAESDIRGKPCAATKSCAQSDVDDVKKKYLIGDISMAAGVVALGVGAVLYFTAPKSPATAASARRFDVLPLPGGGFASYGASF